MFSHDSRNNDPGVDITEFHISCSMLLYLHIIKEVESFHKFKDPLHEHCARVNVLLDGIRKSCPRDQG